VSQNILNLNLYLMVTYQKTVYRRAVTHLSTNRARRWATSCTWPTIQRDQATTAFTAVHIEKLITHKSTNAYS